MTGVSLCRPMVTTMTTSKVPGQFDVVRVPFAYEEKPGVFKDRPTVVAARDDECAVLVLAKVTGHGPRWGFPGEVRLMDWEEAGLSKPSTVRCSKTVEVSIDFLIGKEVLGALSERDSAAVLEGLAEAHKVRLQE